MNNVLILDIGDNIRGNCALPGYTGKIELQSFSHGVAMQITGDISNSERASGKPNHQDMTITKYLDAASPILNLACCQGRRLPRAEIIIGRNDGGKILELMRYTLSDVLISSISIGGGGGDKPVEKATLNYSQITWKFTSQKPEGVKDGVVESKWDLTRDAVG